MAGTTSDDASHLVRRRARPLAGDDRDLDPVLEAVDGARFALLGEASHGTQEFYERRATITRRLIVEQGFDAVAVEADWPDAYRVHCWVRGSGTDASAEEVLRGFERFPTWMWRNTAVRDFVAWLRTHNATRDGEPCGFCGLDLYSLHRSVAAVVDYLERVDPPAATRARQRYACFDHADGGEQAAQRYGAQAAFGAGRTCQDEVVAQLVELQATAPQRLALDGRTAADEAFFAEQNARLVVNAEEYHRAMFGSRVSSWNLRDQHMATTLGHLADHLGRQLGRPARIVVWAHNSHLGDARATQMGWDGELNLGQLTRQSHPGEAVLVGFTTNDGTVAAADDWGGPVRRKRVNPALPGSVEALFHDTAVGDFVLALPPGSDVAEALAEARLERAIGVIYRPQTERASHYFLARPSEQFDVLVHLDRTTAVQPLEAEAGAGWDPTEVPETFPHGV